MVEVKDLTDSVSEAGSDTSNKSFPRAAGWARVHHRCANRTDGSVGTMRKDAPEIRAGETEGIMLAGGALDVRAQQQTDEESVIKAGEALFLAPEFRASAAHADEVPTQNDLYRKSPFCFNCLKWGHHQSVCVEARRSRRPPMRDAGRREGFVAFLSHKDTRDSQVRAARKKEDSRRAEDRALEDAQIVNEHRQQDEAKYARRKAEDRARDDKRERDDEEAATADREEKAFFVREYQDRVYRR